MPSATWMVEYHPDAVEELQRLRDRQNQRRVLTIVGILRQIGPKITEPHSKSIAGAVKLYELRPGGGRTTIRPLYFRFDDRTFKVVALAPEAMTDPAGFRAAVERAQQRARRDYGQEV
ncbi:type II toxin-antitoxin system RelE/ParE family toxin [Baekduia sp. Peel2402]|uniref:type II toxin-antitoxin system RelE/ParE family toxin n=1 Tax=Baekduia sp. Peel2402 TaxID=3458296 RepID=UPI00403E8DC3